jgi:hypothetical protein
MYLFVARCLYHKHNKEFYFTIKYKIGVTAVTKVEV